MYFICTDLESQFQLFVITVQINTQTKLRSFDLWIAKSSQTVWILRWALERFNQGCPRLAGGSHYFKAKFF